MSLGRLRERRVVGLAGRVNALRASLPGRSVGLSGSVLIASVPYPRPSAFDISGIDGLDEREATKREIILRVVRRSMHWLANRTAHRDLLAGMCSAHLCLHAALVIVEQDIGGDVSLELAHLEYAVKRFRPA